VIDHRDPQFTRWLDALQKRHLAELTFSEVRRALQALSTHYVEQRGGLTRGAALSGAGKRAAFALFYGPLHFLTVREIAGQLSAASREPSRVLDLGCGSGAAGAAFALAAKRPPAIEGIDLNPWAVAEARWTWSQFGLSGRARKGNVIQARLPGNEATILLGYTVNELAPEHRRSLKQRLLAATEKGASVLIVEPIARRLTPWWNEWTATFAARKPRTDDWRLPIELPEPLSTLDKAAGLNHRELTARTLWIP